MSLGIGAIAEIINYTNEIDLFTNHQIISLSEETQTIKISTVDLKATYNINGLEIKNNNLLTFAGILRLLLGTTGNTGNTINYSQELYEQYNQQSFFSKGIKLIIIVLLSILLINFFRFFSLLQLSTRSLRKSYVKQIFT